MYSKKGPFISCTVYTWHPGEFVNRGLFIKFAVLFKIITRMKLSFSNHLGDCSYSFQGSSELICIAVTVPVFFYETMNLNSIRMHIYIYIYQKIAGNSKFILFLRTWDCFRILDVVISKRMVKVFSVEILQKDGKV